MYLLNVFVALGGRREDAGDIQGRIVLVFGLLFCLRLFEQPIVFNGVVDRRRCQERIEAALVGGGIMLFNDLGNNGFRRCGLLPAFFLIASGCLPEVVDMKAQHVFVFNGMGDGVGVQLFLENSFSGFIGTHCAVDLLIGRVVFKNRRAGKAE